MKVNRRAEFELASRAITDNDFYSAHMSLSMAIKNLSYAKAIGCKAIKIIDGLVCEAKSITASLPLSIHPVEVR